MQFKTFIVPIVDGNLSEDELNQFLRSVKVLEVKRELVLLESGGYWAFCISYLPQQTASGSGYATKVKIDYKEILSEQEFTVFAELRKIRKILADKDAVPAFAVFTDAELAQIAKLKMIDKNGVMGISGIGEKKMERYGNTLIELYNKGKEAADETQG